MDGFRERLTGRYLRGDREDIQDRNDRSNDRMDRGSERASMRSDSRYDRSSDYRYEGRNRAGSDRDAVSIAAIAEQIDSSNRDQLEVITELFDDAKADRIESEKAIINAISDRLEQVQDYIDRHEENKEDKTAEEEVIPTLPNSEVLDRIERMSSQNAETINENNEMLVRSINSIRANADMLNEIRGSVGSVQMAAEDLKASNVDLAQLIRNSISNQMQTYSQADDSSNEEILSALSDNRSMLNMLRQDILNGFARSEEADNAEDNNNRSEGLSAEAADKYYKDMEEHVHKECVKCYRNVQSTLEEQNEEAHNKSKKEIGEVRTVAVISLALNVVIIVLLICQTLGII